jgi:hypothetical protein
MKKKSYLRFINPQKIIANGKEISFTEWHWLEVMPLANEHDSPSMVCAIDCRGHMIKILHRDLCAWNRRFILTEDFGPLGIHETVDVLDPSTCDGETIVVIAGKAEIKVPVKHLAPFSGRHVHEGAVAV